MTWLKIDDGFYEHQKIVGLSNQAFRLHVSALCMCSRLLTDGRVTHQNLRKLSADLPFNVRRYVQELVAQRLWIEFKSGYRIKDFLEYNPSSVEIKERRQKAALRQSRFRENHKLSTGSNAKHNALRNGTPDPTRNKTELPTTYNENLAEVIDLEQRVHDSFGGIA